MLETKENPFGGKPLTEVITDSDGSEVFIVKPRELTPIRAICVKILAFITMAAALFAAISNAHRVPDQYEWVWLLLVALIIPLYLCVKFIWRWILKKRTTLVLSPEHIKFKRGATVKRLDRALETTFQLFDHDWKEKEAELFDLLVRRAQARGEVIQPEVFFGKSFHIAVIFAGRRIDLLTVYGKRASRNIVDRLNQCNAALNLRTRANGLAISPEVDWGEITDEIDLHRAPHEGGNQ